MRLPVHLLGLTSSGSFVRSRLRTFTVLATLGLTVLAAACSDTLGVGQPLPENAASGDSDASAPPAPVPPALPSPPPAPAAYAWQWTNPHGTGVAMRGAFTLPSGETWSVGDNGTVMRETAGVATVMRVGIEEEILTAAWGRSSDDIWVGGSRGTAGLLIHWNGKSWSDSYPIAKRPVDALHGLTNGNIVVVSAGEARLMHPEGTVLNSCGGSVQFGYGLVDVRDVWVQSDDEIWLTGEGVARWTLSQSRCVHLDDRKTFGVWGDGTRIVVASQKTDQFTLELRERVADGFVSLGAPFGDSLREVRGGKLLAGDATGHIRFVMHGLWGERDSYVTYDPATHAVTETLLTAVDSSPRGPLYGEVIYGLATSGAQMTFVGGRGLRGRFDGKAILPLAFRRRLLEGIASPDGTPFALCTNYWESSSTSVCRWSASSGWTELPTINHFYGFGGVATSATSILIGGVDRTSPSWTSPAIYRTREWNGATWSQGPQQNTYLFAPLFTTGPSDVWAWSDYDLIHFDGSMWSTISHGSPATGGFRMVDGLGPKDVWLLDRSAGLSHWDGSALRNVAPLPAFYAARDLDRGLLAVADGAWIVGVRSGGWPQSDRLMHWNGQQWNILELPGIGVRSLARGPDGKVRMLSMGDATPGVYIVDDSGITKELDVPEGVYLNDIFASGEDFFAIGETGATLQLVKVASTSTH